MNRERYNEIQDMRPNAPVHDLNTARYDLLDFVANLRRQLSNWKMAFRQMERRACKEASLRTNLEKSLNKQIKELRLVVQDLVEPVHTNVDEDRRQRAILKGRAILNPPKEKPNVPPLR